MIGPSYCISLASKPDRRAFCQRQFAAEGLDVAIFDAIVVADRGEFPTVGSRGCYLSHRTVLERALDEWTVGGRIGDVSDGIVTIFEDDVLLPRGFGQITKRVLAQLDREPDWTMIYWGSENAPPTRPVPSRPLLATIAPQHTIIGKQAYTIRMAAIPALLKYLHFCETHHPSYSDGMYHSTACCTT